MNFKKAFSKQLHHLMPVFFLYNLNASAQVDRFDQGEMDSLKKVFTNETVSLKKVKAIYPMLRYYRVRNDFATADSLLKIGVGIADKSGEKLAIVYAHMNYFTNYGTPEKIRIEMRANLEKAIQLAQEGGFKNEEIICLANLGYHYANFHYSLEKALEYFTKADLNDESVTDSVRSIYYYNKGVYYMATKDVVNGYKTAITGLKYAKKAKSEDLLRKSYRVLAIIYSRLNDHENANKWYEKEKESWEKSGDKRGIVNIKYLIARSNKEWGNNEKAVGMYKTVLKESEAINDPFNMSMAASNLCFLYLDMGKVDEARAINNRYKTFERGLKTGDKLSYYFDWGNFYYSFNKDSSRYFYDKAIEIADSAGTPSTNLTLFNYAGGLYRKTGDAKKGIVLLEKALALNKEIGVLDRYTDIYSELDSAYQLLGDYKNAYAARSQYKFYQDSIDKLSDKNALMRAEIATEEENQKKQQEAEQKSIAKKHNIQYTAIGIGGLILMVSMLMLSFFHTPKWVIRVLTFVSFIFLFEFLILILDTKIHHWAHGAPLPILLIKITIACLIVPLHHWIEHKVLHFLHTKKLQVKTVKKEKSYTSLK